MLLNFANIVPAGMVVFVPSYGFLHVTLEKWKAGGVLEKLNARKKVGYTAYACRESFNALFRRSSRSPRTVPKSTASFATMVLQSKAQPKTKERGAALCCLRSSEQSCPKA